MSFVKLAIQLQVNLVCIYGKPAPEWTETDVVGIATAWKSVPTSVASSSLPEDQKPKLEQWYKDDFATAMATLEKEVEKVSTKAISVVSASLKKAIADCTDIAEGKTGKKSWREGLAVDATMDALHQAGKGSLL
eukprot:3572730-Amphidinium_carterae.1